MKKCTNIKILLTDVDGVLTDGGMYYSAYGDIMKKFNAKDGMGINILRKKNIPTIIVTKEKKRKLDLTFHKLELNQAIADDLIATNRLILKKTGETDIFEFLFLDFEGKSKKNRYFQEFSFCGSKSGISNFNFSFCENT